MKTNDSSFSVFLFTFFFFFVLFYKVVIFLRSSIAAFRNFCIGSRAEEVKRAKQ
jgi:hypothetical protein